MIFRLLQGKVGRFEKNIHEYCFLSKPNKREGGTFLNVDLALFCIIYVGEKHEGGKTILKKGSKLKLV